ncbi:MAG: hypothetical protein LBD78_07135 [Spirochaetaceae bacterium]|jgi:hypothetical protein|nr:hypothetical protein [Spirochaetaceae bacterium]
MTINEKKQLILGELQKDEGILRFAPCWVARNFMQPGRRLKLDPRDYYFGDLSSDEMFVTEEAAKRGVVITNHSDYENIVMLKHFGPDNPESAHLVKTYAV